MKTFFYLVLFLLTFSGCVKSLDENYWKAEYIGSKNIKHTELVLDTLVINGSNTSCVGNWSCSNNMLIWGDYLFNSFYLYDTTLTFNHRLLGKGRGPKELPAGRIAGYTFNKDKLFVLGSSADFYEIDSDWTVIKKSYFRFIQEDVSLSKLKNNPKPEYIGIYEINYPAVIVKCLDSNHIILPIESSHPLFNGYTSKDYYSDARVLMSLNVKTSKIEKIFGRYSPIYSNYHYIPQFSNILFDVNKNSIVMSFEADSLIYVFNKPDKLDYKFGNKGRQMNQDYPEVQTYRNYVEIYKTQRPIYGYYKYVKCFPKHNLIFRGYQKGGEEKFEGLQIYKKGILIGDVDVPKGMKVIGYIKPYFYAEAPPNEITQKLIIYRFKL